jgi:hypothetical protein
MNSQTKRLKEASIIIDNLYQNKWFIDLSKDKRVEKVNEVLLNVSVVNDIATFDANKGEWNDEKRKDSPHHYDNRLD